MNTRSTLATAHELAGEISTLYAHINAATFTLLEKIREFDDLQLYGDLNCRSTAHWLNYACGIGLGAGREKVRVAHALATLPEIESAFREGRVSYSKVRALTRVATAENETHFLNIAYHSTASQTERIVRNHQNVIAASESDTFTRRSLEFLWLSDGSLSFKGRLSADQGALFLKALDQAFLENEGRDFYAVLDRKEPVNAKRADALMVVTERAMAADPVSSASADRYQVTVHVNADTLLGQFQHDDPPQVENGPVLTVKTAERLTCDASIVPMLESAGASR
ncbi:MAG: DUF222 domain-containing protein [Gammaproteobacteria bacterium]|nr:DUF222 domain-containing protein [Gammaproteobacteria bacterium]